MGIEKRHMPRNKFDYGILFPFAVFVAFIVFGIIGISQWGFENLINTLAFDIAFRSSITLVCLFGILYKKQKYLRLKKLEIILLSTTIFLNWLLAFNPILRLSFALHFLYVFGFGVLYIVFYLKNKRDNFDYNYENINQSYSMIIFLLLSVAFVVNFLRFNFENASMLIGLWISLIAAIPIAILICLFPAKEEMLGYPRWGQILFVFTMYFISIVLSMIIVFSINYCFDFKQPTYVSYEILEKQVSYNGLRSPLTHEVKIERDGKEDWIIISQEEYYSLETGNKITLATYLGALGIKYSLLNK